MKRTALTLFTTVALLTQGLAWASTAPAMGEASRFASTARGDAERPHMDVRAGGSDTQLGFAMDGIKDGSQAMPCHGEKESIQKQSPCCGEACDCPELCAGSATVVSPSFLFTAALPATFSPATLSPLRLSVHHHEHLKPPIALQS